MGSSLVQALQLPAGGTLSRVEATSSGHSSGEASPAGAAGAASSSEAAHCCHDPSATRQEGLPNMSMHSFRTSPR